MTDRLPNVVYLNSNKSVQEEPIMVSIQTILTYGVITLAIILVISGIVGIVNYIRKNAGQLHSYKAFSSFTVMWGFLLHKALHLRLIAVYYPWNGK